MYINVCIYIIQFSSATKSCLTLCDPVYCITLGFPVHHQLLELTQTHVHRVGDAIQPSHILSSPSPPAFNLSQHQGLFQWVSSSHQVAKVMEFQLQHSPSNEYSGLISFRMDWLDLLAVQGTLKSILQHHSSKASIPQCSAFFIVQLSHPYMTHFTFTFNQSDRKFYFTEFCMYLLTNDFMYLFVCMSDMRFPFLRVCPCFHWVSLSILTWRCFSYIWHISTSSVSDNI